MNKDTEIVPFSPYTFYLKDYLFSGWIRNGRLLRNVSRSISAARYARPWAACTPLSGQAAAYVWDGYGKLRGERSQVLFKGGGDVHFHLSVPVGIDEQDGEFGMFRQQGQRPFQS